MSHHILARRDASAFITYNMNHLLPEPLNSYIKTRLWKPVFRARPSDLEVDRRGHRPPMKLENRNVLIYDFDRPRVDRSQESFDDDSDARNRAATLNLRNHPTQEA